MAGAGRQARNSKCVSEDQWNDERNMHKAVVASLNTELEKKTKEAEHYIEETKRIGKLLDTMTQERNDLTQRLSQEMATKIGMNETCLENISIKNRPLKVAEEYDVLCSHSWLSAKDTLDECMSCSDEEKIHMLRGFLLEVQDIAAMKYKELTISIYEMMTVHTAAGTAAGVQSGANPIVLARPQVPKELKDQTAMTEELFDSIPDGLKIAISDFIRTSCDTVDIKGISEEVTKRLGKKLQDPKPTESLASIPSTKRETLSKTMIVDKEKGSADFRSYINDCSRLAWKMASQRPPMRFDAKTGIGEKWRGERHQQVYFSSQDPQDPENVVQYYIFPTLMHKDRIMKIGTVYVGPNAKERTEEDKPQDGATSGDTDANDVDGNVKE